MQELVKITDMQIGNEKVSGCDARELHEKLEVGRDFSTWIKGRLEEAMLVEEKDYMVVFPQTGENPQGGRPSIDYQLSLDAAKHIAMLERTEIGHQVRQYFIEFERRAIAALRAMAEAHREQGELDIVKVQKTLTAAKKSAKEMGMNEAQSRKKAAEMVKRVHQVDIYEILGMEAPDNATGDNKILEWAKRKGKDVVSCRDLCRHSVPGCKYAQGTKVLMQELVDRGLAKWIERQRLQFKFDSQS